MTPDIRCQVRRIVKCKYFLPYVYLKSNICVSIKNDVSQNEELGHTQQPRCYLCFNSCTNVNFFGAGLGYKGIKAAFSQTRFTNTMDRCFIIYEDSLWRLPQENQSPWLLAQPACGMLQSNRWWLGWQKGCVLLARGENSCICVKREGKERKKRRFSKRLYCSDRKNFFQRKEKEARPTSTI